MKTANFIKQAFCQSRSAIGIAVCVICYGGLANAENPALLVDASKPVDLVLSLPNQWHPAGISRFSDMHKAAMQGPEAFNESAGEQKKSKKVNVGCEVGVNENALATSSMTGRMEGNCKLNFHY